MCSPIYIVPLLATLAGAAVTPYAHYRMGDGSPATNGGRNLPYDSSGNARHMANSAPGTPAIRSAGGPHDDAFYTFSGNGQYFYGTTGSWDPPEDNVGVEAWVRTSNLSQVNRHIFGTGDNTKGINLGFDATGGAGWFGAVANRSMAGTSGVAGYVAGTWIHLAAVRASGTTTFYADGVPLGTTVAVPNNSAGAASLHMAVTSGGASQFDGDIAEARIFTFDGGSFDPATDLLVTPAATVSLREEHLTTVPGTTYVASFGIRPEAGQSSVPRLRLGIAGDSTLRDVPLLASLPEGAPEVPYRIRFTADSSTTTLKFTTISGDTASPDQIASPQVLEPLTATPSTAPNPGQQGQIDRRYGLFLHFGINTFHNEEWTDGSKPVASYSPAELDVEQWVRTAYEAGMRYVLVIAKHHDGFCMWNSPWTTYDVGSSPVPQDVVSSAAAACRKYGIRLALYYSLWDRHETSYATDDLYNQYMLRQLGELLGGYGPVCELWLDGGWDKTNTRWPVLEIYDLARRLQPDCQVSINWTIGSPGNSDQALVLPSDQREGYPIRYFPADFRLGDPYLPAFPDPKVFTHDSGTYYLPFEATVTLSAQNRWFFNTGDLANKPIRQLAGFYYAATAQNNMLVLNAPPDRGGRIRATERDTLLRLRDLLGLSPGVRLPRNVTGASAGSASSIWGNDVAGYGPQHALDGDPSTRWASGPSGTTNGSLEVDFTGPRTFSRILIDEFEPTESAGRITGFRLQSWDGSSWKTFHAGGKCGRFSLHDFATVTTSKVRLLIDEATDAASIWEFQIHDADHAFSTWRDHRFPIGGTSNPACAWDGDPDGDGRDNLTEFAFDDNPNDPEPTRKIGVFRASPAHPPVFVVPVRDGAVFLGSPSPGAAIDGITYRIEGSLDLGTFSAPLIESPVEQQGMPALSPGWSYRGFRHVQPDLAAGFFRVRTTVSGGG